MSVIFFSFSLFLISFLTGIFGILTGLGGGMLLVPILTQMGIDLHVAMGASLISILTTSLCASITQTGIYFTNTKIGIFLETGAIIGAIAGAFLLPYLSISVLSILFSFVLMFSSYTTYARGKSDKAIFYADDTISHVNLKSYSSTELLKGWLLIFFGGILSSILGVGSGAVKVLAMDQVLRLPYKISTATSNFMVGMTATASMGIYFQKGYIDYKIAYPIILGVFIGALLGSKILGIASSRSLRSIFSVIVIILALQMLYFGLKESTWISKYF